MTELSGHTRLIGLFATPIRHSISPLIQNTALKECDVDAVYLAFDLGEDRLEQAIQSIKTLDMLGANLSMPNKMKAMDFMDELSESATLIGAINTIKNDHGKLVGYNTDGIGFMTHLNELKIDTIGKKITIIGAGGAATAIIAQAALDGVREIAVYNQKDVFYDRAKKKLTEISKNTSCDITLKDLSDEAQLEQDITDSVLLVNATGVGMKPLEMMTPIKQMEWIRPELFVYDVIYTPKETEFLKQARLRGAKTSNGLGMLLYQGAAAFNLWTDKEMPIEKIKPLLQKI